MYIVIVATGSVDDDPLKQFTTVVSDHYLPD